MNTVLDASALLALLHNEQGTDKVADAILNKAAISSVNWTEVIQKAIAKKINIENLDQDLAALGLTYFDFDMQQAHIAGNLWQQTKPFGLSLGDRACLAGNPPGFTCLDCRQNMGAVEYWRTHQAYSLINLFTCVRRYRFIAGWNWWRTL